MSSKSRPRGPKSQAGLAHKQASRQRGLNVIGNLFSGLPPPPPTKRQIQDHLDLVTIRAQIEEAAKKSRASKEPEFELAEEDPNHGV